MQTFSIQGMTCMGCVAIVTETLQTVDQSVRVTLNPPQVIVSKNVTLNDLQQALKSRPKYHIFEQKNADIPLVPEKSTLQTFMPMIVILTLIALVSLKDAFDWHGWMMSFMAGFFIVFGGFKLFDLKGFVDAYQTYDIIAKRVKAYAFAYPFIEIGLGFAFLFHYKMKWAVWLSIVLSLIGLVSVIKALRAKQAIRCACLGTSLNLPMTKVTFIENAGMLVMGLLML